MAKNTRLYIFLLIGIGCVIVLGASIGSFVLFRQLMPRDNASVVNQQYTNQPGNAPKLSVSTVTDGLKHPWEVVFLPDKTMLISERYGAISHLSKSGVAKIYTPSDVVATGEGGMLGLAIDPEFTQNRFIYACYNTLRSGIVVARLNVSQDVTAAREDKKIITGMPSNPSGRHSGCRLAFGPDKNLWIGTGDAADESTPQNLNSLGGKILRVDRDGKGVAGNISNGDNRIYSYGHRNVQGLAFYDKPSNDSYGISVEHGSNQDDEINELKPGNFGWAPGAGYDESVPMTDKTKFPNAVSALWTSGNPTIAPSDADFIKGANWGSWNGRLAMAVLKEKHLRILDVSNGKISEQLRLFVDEYGRIRAVTMGPDGSLYVSTDNGSDDKILKITPQQN